MNKKFKVGDDIVCFAGYGKVIEVDNSTYLSIKIKLDEDKTTLLFYDDGKYARNDIFPTLFHIENKPEHWKKKREKEIKSYVIVNNKDNTIDSYFRHYEDATRMANMNQTVVELKGKHIIEE